MKDVMKDQQKEVRAKMDELNKLKTDHEASQKTGTDSSNPSSPRNGLWGTIIGAAAPFVGSAVGGALGGPFGAMLGSNILGTIVGSSSSNASSSSSASGSLTDTQKKANADYQDSRQMMMEELKNMMQKLQQMQQAPSNVLNSMHQGAMNSVRNIRA
jgi:hypothetical protein